MPVYSHPLVRQLWCERQRQRLSMTKLSAQTGYSRESLYKWEKGGTRMSIYTVVDVAKALGYELVLKEIK